VQCFQHFEAVLSLIDCQSQGRVIAVGGISAVVVRQEHSERTAVEIPVEEAVMVWLFYYVHNVQI
jgi:hypothetical protein